MRREDDLPKGRTVARVTAGTPPKSVRTIEQWRAWRRAEDERMYAELAAQLQAHIEREGANKH